VDCEARICPDLVGATVIEHRVPGYQRDQECYRIVKGVLEVDACMELNLSTGVCTIWYDRRADRETRNHERSHCNGWAHTWDPQKRKYRWFPMDEVRKYDFSASSGATQRGEASASKEAGK
jgi:hypothetical protein